MKPRRASPLRSRVPAPELQARIRSCCAVCAALGWLSRGVAPPCAEALDPMSSRATRASWSWNWPMVKKDKEKNEKKICDWYRFCFDPVVLLLVMNLVR